MPFQFMAQVFWVQQQYPDHAVLYTSLLSTSRGLAMVLFSLIGGAIADRAERRRVLLVTESASLAANALIAVVMILAPFGSATVAAVAVGTFFAAGVMSIDSPARSASLPAAAGIENIPAAIGLLSISGQLMMPVSLPLVGFLTSAFSPGAVYAGSLLMWLGILPLIAMLRYHSVGGGRQAGMLENIRAGISYTRSSRAISAVLSIVIIMQLLGMPVNAPLGVMFEIKVLKLSSSQVGLIAATWGLGAFAASLTLTRLRWLTLRGITLATLAVVFATSVMGFGYSRLIPVTAVFDFGMGFGFTATMLTASTLVQRLVDDSMRGRVMSLFPFSVGVGYVCTAGIGGIGQAVGLAILIPALGWATLLGCAGVVTWNRQLLRARIRPPVLGEQPADAARAS